MKIRSKARKWLKKKGIYARRMSQLPMGVYWMRDARRILGREPVIVMDVGANIGQTTQDMRAVFPTTEIYSFEPIPATFNALKENVASLVKVWPYQLALDEAQGKKTILAIDGSTFNSLDGSRFAGDQDAHEVEILCTTLDIFCEENKITEIDILKSDTEGFDLQVIKGAERLFNERRINLVYCEVTFDPNNHENSNFYEVSAQLSNHQFFPVNIYSHEALFWGRLGRYCDVLFAHKSLLPGFS